MSLLYLEHQIHFPFAFKTFNISAKMDSGKFLKFINFFYLMMILQTPLSKGFFDSLWNEISTESPDTMHGFKHLTKRYMYSNL